MRLVGLQLENYRSIGSEGVLLQPIRKCSVLVGQNNVGKSNVLRAIQSASALVAALRPRRGAGHAVGSGKSFDLANSYRKTGQPFKMVLYFEFDAEGELEDLLRPAIPGGAVEFQLEANPGEKARVVNSTFHDLSRNHQDVRRTRSDFTVHNDLQRKVLGTHYSSQPPKEEMNRRLGEIGENLFHNRFAQLVLQSR